MVLTEKIPPLEAAKKVVQKYYPQCHCALLAGSVVRGEATATSDLDIIVFDTQVKDSYRESFIDFGWPIEAFVHNLTSYKTFFKGDVERVRPSLPRMIFEGQVIKNSEMIASIKEEARQILENGPAEWSAQTIDMKRYFLTDTLDDFIGSTNRGEAIFIANTIGELASEFILRTNKRWIGTSKWTIRALKQFDEQLAKDFVEAFELFYRENQKDGIVQLVDRLLAPFGGRLFEGFAVGKK